MFKIKDYKKIVGGKKIEELYDLSCPLVDKHVVNLSSTFYGGGVSEILASMVPLIDDLGIHCGWRIVRGSREFFRSTKKIHNSLQGDNTQNLSFEEKSFYIKENEYNARFTHLDHDLVIVHDPQPLPIINYYKKTQPWIWRCHIDLSKPNLKTWNYIKKFVNKYDKTVFSMKNYIQKEVRNKSEIIAPSIDPLSTKNIKLKESKISNILKNYNIDQDKPIISQISRFDKWKDPEGVIDCFKLVKRKIKCRLVLLGSFAADDPEGEKLYRNVIKKAEDDPDITIIAQEDNFLVNALQQKSALILQKSIKEGFALTVSEALYKGTPVIGSNVGGIKLQIKDGWNGYLVDPNNTFECVKKIEKILKNPKLGKKMGLNGKDYVKENFLITRQVKDWINLMNSVLK